MEKTTITNLRNDSAKFLGTTIKRLNSQPKIVRNTRGHQQRVSGGNIIMNAPITQLLERLKKKAFLKDVEGVLTPIGVLKFTALPIKDMILHFRTFLAGYLNYYSFVDNIQSLRTIY